MSGPSAVPTAEALRAGDRQALARAITLVESTRSGDRAAARSLLEELLPHTGAARRLGITGVPGVGKSTFIEGLGGRLTDRGHRVAVLAVDPSSVRSGGSILGDKTRMTTLARNPRAFIRPSPGAGTLGGVARRTRECGLLCEAAGFDVVLIETIGTGQSETAVAGMVDTFVLLQLAGAGDELQGIKRGIVELADVVVLNKADGAGREAAEGLRPRLAAALHVLAPATPEWQVPVLLASARTGEGIDEVWEATEAHRRHLIDAGLLEPRRREQARAWFRNAVQDLLAEALDGHPEAAALRPRLEEDVVAGRISPGAAAERLVALLRG